MRMLFKSLLRNIGRASPSAAPRVRTTAELMAEGRELFDANDLVRAQLLFEDVLEIDPGHADALHFMGLTGHRIRDLGFALEYFERSIQARPNDAVFHSNLGSILVQAGRSEEAVVYFRKALEIDPGLHAARANLIFILVLLESVRPEEVYAEHVAWARIHADPFLAQSKPHANSRDPERRLRVGYLSADFREHALSYFITPALEQHDGAAIEVFCYYSGRIVDDATRRLAQYADHWHDIIDLDDDQAAELIRGHGIDILIDLSGHLRENRLLVFARKPAPIQVTYLAYPNTTGMRAMDYRITDGVCDPPGATERYYRETLIRLPRCMWCYQPRSDMPDVSPSPAKKSGGVTFASMNGASKVTPRMLALWARVLGEVPGSRIVLTTVPEQGRERIRDALTQAGVAAERFSLHDRLPTKDFWALYADIDILLDTFPMNGGTTTCEALWLGVPVITRSGAIFQSRAGMSILGSMGLDELIALSDEDYVRIAVDLAHDTNRLVALRAGLRERMRDSSLTAARPYARALEAAYRDIWRSWCIRPLQ
ncbi:MAG: tetratricopeptide repeat protein [Betaproteobacteria bacterium]|nr:MAG: tetratricopeptide repeat protein [Betaproteobacteria bacterium]